MPRDWSAFARDKNVESPYEEDHFRSAAYQLLTQQVLYERERNDRVAYHIVNTHRAAYREAFDLFGMDLEFDDAYRYCVAIPRSGRGTQLTLVETLLVLVLRKIYHERAMHADLVDGAAHVSLEELQEAYRAETGRELPTTMRELEFLLDTMKRYGVLRRVAPAPGSAQPFGLELRPGIEKLVNENMLTRMAAYQKPSVDIAQETNGASGQGETDETA